jgi:hypothetical protein
MTLPNDFMINEFKQFFQLNSSSSSPSSSPTATFKSIINDIQRLAWVGTLCKEGKHKLIYTNY